MMNQFLNSVPLQLALQVLKSASSDRNRTQIWMRQLPDEFPIELPFLDQSQITASLQQGQTFTILMQISQPSLLIESTYSNYLRTIGWLQWHANEDFVNCNLFVSTSYRSRSLTSPLIFCYRPQALTLTLQTISTTENITHIKLKLFSIDMLDSPCQEEWERSVLNTLPLVQLVPPDNTDIPLPIDDVLPSRLDDYLQKQEAGGTDREWYSGSSLQTSLSGSVLIAYYEAQLSQAGWTQQAGEKQDQVLWSAWVLNDQHYQMWQLLVSFVADSNDNDSGHYSASLQMLNLDAFEPACLSVSPPLVTSPDSIPKDVLWQLLSDDSLLNIEAKQLWIGQFPPTFSTALELPHQTQVLGSLVEEDIEIIMFLTVPLSLDRVSEYLIKQLHNLGWQNWSNWNDPKGVGFETSIPEQLNQVIFNNPIDGTQCEMLFTPVTLNNTDVEIRWILSSEPTDELLEASNPETFESDLSLSPMPTLAKPNQTEVALGAGGPRGRNMSGVYVITSLTAEALIGHYHTEMRKAGWQPQTVSQVQNCHFSLWSFTDEEGQLWRGILSLLARPERDNHYTGALKISRLPYTNLR